MKDLYTVAELTSLLGISGKTVSVRVKGLDYEMRPGPAGRKVRHYKLSALPKDWIASIVDEGKSCENDDGRLKRLEKLSEIDDRKLDIASRRAELLSLCSTFCRDAGYQIRNGYSRTKKGETDFLRLCRAGKIIVPDRISEKIKIPSWTTLNRWYKAYDSHGVAGLSVKYKAHNRKATKLTASQQEKLTALMIRNPHASLANYRRGLQGAENSLDIPSDRVLLRFVERWKKENKELWQLTLNPAGRKDKHMFAVGDASGGVDRLYQLVEGDSSPADLMLNVDGKLARYSLIALIDIYSRQAQLLVAPTSTGNAIVAALRRWITTKGVMEGLRIDNGHDWVSNRVSGVLRDLEIDTTLCGKFKSEEKPFVERFFKTFLHGVLELCPHFIGHNVSERQAIEERKTFAERVLKTGGEPVETAATPEEFQRFCDDWTDIVYYNDEHSTLGCSPAEMVRSWKHPVRRITDERMLDNLLLPAAHRNGLRRIRKQGVQVESGANYPYYAAEEFAEYAGRDVLVYTDPLDMGRIVCYLPDGEGGRKYLCEAVNLEWAGINRAEFASKLKKRQAKYVNEAKRALNRRVKAAAIDDVHNQYIELRKKQHAGVLELPKQVETVSTRAIEQAALVGKTTNVVNSAPANNVPPRRKVIKLRSDSELYEEIRCSLRDTGREMTNRDVAFLRDFYMTLTGKAALKLHGDLIQKYAAGGDKKKQVNL